MKKLVTIISAFSIAVSMLSPAVFAENKDNTMQAVLESVKKRVEIPEECTEFSSNVDVSFYGAVTNHSFHWRSTDHDKYVDVQCYDDGVISGYYTPDYPLYGGKPSIPALSKEDAKKIAEDFVEKINPDFPYEVRIEDDREESLYSGGYEFSADLYVEGIRFDKGYIRVNGKTGNVTQFSIGYVPIEFPSVKNAISREEAQKAYSEKLGLEMIYRTYTDKDGKDIAYPVYVQKYNYNKYINALTGDVVDENEFEIRGYNTASGMSMKEAATADDSGLSPQEIKELENIKGLISKEEIEKQVRKNTILNIPASADISDIRLTKSYNKDDYTYSINMTDKANKVYIYLYADAKTGEILGYNRYGDDKESDSVQNDEALKSLAGDKADEYKYNENSKMYERYVNGIRAASDTARIAYSGDTLVGYSISYTDTQFPSVDKAMSVSEAEKLMFDRDGYEMTYILKYVEKGVEIVPVYRHNPVSINPFTGKYVDYRNEEITANGRIEYSDISGHYAEQYISELAYYGVGFEGGEFKPDEKITQQDFLTLLTAVYQDGTAVLRTDNDQTDYIYRISVRKDIISEDERDDNAIVTRDTAAVYMIRAIGAEEFAKYNNIYISPFKDVTENKGYIALLNAMGVVSGDSSGKFNPSQEITRAEFAVMLYKYLSK